MENDFGARTSRFNILKLTPLSVRAGEFELILSDGRTSTITFITSQLPLFLTKQSE